MSEDHKVLSDKIERLLHQLHAKSREDVELSSPPFHTTVVGGHDVAAPLAVPSASTYPFAIIDEIEEKSPAKDAGLQLGDKIILCGHVTGQTPNCIQAMGNLVSQSENKPLNVVVYRNNEQLTLELCPKKWAGRGLLGCHVKPYK